MLEKNSGFCPKCGCKVINYNLNNDEKTAEYKKKEMRYIIFSLFLIVLAQIIKNIQATSEFFVYLSCMWPIIYCAAIISVIFARIKMKDSKKIKIMFNIIVYGTLIWLAFLILVTVACFLGYNLIIV